MLLLLRWVFAGVAVVLVIAYVVRPVLRMVREKPDVDLMTPDYTSMQDDELEIPAEEDQEFNRHAAIDQARKDPQATAMMVQKWLKQRK